MNDQQDCPSVADALAGVKDGSTVLIGGFGTAGIPNELIDGLIEQGARDLTVVNNNAGNGDAGLAALLKAGRVRKIICSFPRQADSQVFDALYRSGKHRARTGAAGQPGRAHPRRRCRHRRFLLPDGYGTELAGDGARKRARSTAGITCSNTRFMATWP